MPTLPQIQFEYYPEHTLIISHPNNLFPILMLPCNFLLSLPGTLVIFHEISPSKPVCIFSPTKICTHIWSISSNLISLPLTRTGEQYKRKVHILHVLHRHGPTGSQQATSCTTPLITRLAKLFFNLLQL